MAEVISMFDKLIHTYGGCIKCESTEWAMLVDDDDSGSCKGFQCLECGVVGLFKEKLEIVFELE